MAHSRMTKVTMIFVSFVAVAALVPAIPAAAQVTPAINGNAGNACTTALLCAPVNASNVLAPAASVNCQASGSVFISPNHECVPDNNDTDTAVATQAAWTLGSYILKFTNYLNHFVLNAASDVVGNVLTAELGSTNAINSPTLAAKNGNTWFVGQIAVIRSIGLYFMVPLLMLVVIQSIVKGSLYFLLRAVLIMMPVAVIGGIACVAMAQLFVHIADDMSVAIANYTSSVNGYGNSLKGILTKVDPGHMGLFGWLWFFMFVLAAFAILAELVLREIGIYLSTLFLPFAYAALVWPPATRYARRLSELLIGLIFSKVFIVAAFSLGLAAFGHIQTGATQTANGAVSQSAAAISSIMVAVVIMLMAAFAGAKVLAFTPAATAAAEGYIMNRASITGRAQKANSMLNGVRRRQEKRSQGITPQAGFQNKVRPPSVGAPPPPPPMPPPGGGGSPPPPPPP